MDNDDFEKGVVAGAVINEASSGADGCFGGCGCLAAIIIILAFFNLIF